MALSVDPPGDKEIVTYPRYFNISMSSHLTFVVGGSDVDTTVQRGEDRGCPFVIVGSGIFRIEGFVVNDTVKVFISKDGAPAWHVRMVCRDVNEFGRRHLSLWGGSECNRDGLRRIHETDVER